MLHRTKFAVPSEMNSKHLSTVWTEHVKLLVHGVTSRFYKIISPTTDAVV
jgi:hypothetical protein